MKSLLLLIILGCTLLPSCTYQQIMATQTAINGFSALAAAAQREKALRIAQEAANQPQVVHVCHHNVEDGR